MKLELYSVYKCRFCYVNGIDMCMDGDDVIVVVAAAAVKVNPQHGATAANFIVVE